ncbi:MAG TPA: hypothetical protein VF120_02765 [Ktedonobacterales bacterium]
MAKRRRPAARTERTDARRPKRTAGAPTKPSAAHQLALPLDSAPLAAPPVRDAEPARTRTSERAHALVATRSARADDSSSTAPMRAKPSGPRGERGNVQAHFAELRAALDDGWEIVQPIFARPTWTAVDDSATELHFVLRRDVATRLVTVPAGRGVQRFIREHHLSVDHRQ